MGDSEEYEYSGLHAVIFLGGSSPARIAGLVGALQGEEATDTRIRLATEAVGGRHRGVLHVAVDDENDLAGLQDALVELSRDRDLGTEVAVLGAPYVDSHGHVRAAKIRHCEVVAFVRIWVERGQATVVLNALEEAVGEEVFDGASIVYGAFDVLLTLDGPDLASVAGPALDGVPTISGIVRTETLFADLRRYGPYAES